MKSSATAGQLSPQQRLETMMDDPNTVLTELRSLAAKTNGNAQWANLFEALDGWIQRGGFLPEDWEKPQEATRKALRAALNRPVYTADDGPEYGG